MNRSLTQIWAITRYETLLLWRGMALRVLFVALGSIIIIQGLVVGSQLDEFTARIEGMNVYASKTFIILYTTWIPNIVALTIMLPILVSDTIPKDKQLGVRELLDTTPLTPGAYLLGKVGGVWLATLIGLIVVALLTGIFWWLYVGMFDVQAYVGLWVFGAVAVALLNGALGVLVAAAQPNRRRAVGVMIAFFIAWLLIWGGIESLARRATLDGVAVFMRVMLDGVASVTRSPLLGYFSSPSTILATREDVLLTIAVGLVELALLWFGMQAWLSRRSGQR